MRQLTDHIVSGDQAAQLQIEVQDSPGSGGANHRYQITGFNATNNPSNDDGFPDETGPCALTVLFQNGPIKEAGVNGVTHEALLSILIDRLAAFQNGPFPSVDNMNALEYCRMALKMLQKRTLARIARGVEGMTVA